MACTLSSCLTSSVQKLICSLSVSLSVSFSIYIALSLSFFLFLSHSLSISISLSITHSLTLYLSHSFSISLTHFLSIYLSHSRSVGQLIRFMIFHKNELPVVVGRFIVMLSACVHTFNYCALQSCVCARETDIFAHGTLCLGLICIGKWQKPFKNVRLIKHRPLPRFQRLYTTSTYRRTDDFLSPWQR